MLFRQSVARNKVTKHTMQEARQLVCRSTSFMHTTPVIPHEDRCVGTLLWKACAVQDAVNTADALGASVEGWQAEAVSATHPQGLVRYASSCERQFGHYTDDTQMALALARSVVQVGRVDPADASAAYARDYEPWRGYGGTAHLILKALQTGEGDWQTIGRKHFPEGSFANGGAMRIAPVGLAYRHASKTVLRTAVQDALVCTHVHPEAIDGASVIAAAVAWLCKQPAPDCSQSPDAAGLQTGMVWSAEQQQFASDLLREVLSHSEVHTMRQKLLELQSMLEGDPPTSSAPASAASTPSASAAELQDMWGPYLKTQAWQDELSQVWSLSGQHFQIKAIDAVPQVLYAFCRHALSPQPARAVVAATHYGGDTDTIAAMVGALVGALYGCQGLPATWVDELENGHALGRDGIVALGKALAHVDVST